MKFKDKKKMKTKNQKIIQKTNLQIARDILYLLYVFIYTYIHTHTMCVNVFVNSTQIL